MLSFILCRISLFPFDSRAEEVRAAVKTSARKRQTTVAAAAAATSGRILLRNAETRRETEKWIDGDLRWNVIAAFQFRHKTRRALKSRRDRDEDGLSQTCNWRTEFLTIAYYRYSRYTCLSGTLYVEREQLRVRQVRVGGRSIPSDENV